MQKCISSKYLDVFTQLLNEHFEAGWSMVGELVVVFHPKENMMIYMAIVQKRDHHG